MSKPVERIKSLISSLPENDISLGYKFLKDRNFDSLKMLVDSALYKTKKNIRSENPKEEYLKVDIEELSKLKSEVDLYLSILDPSNEESEEYDEYDNLDYL